MNFLADLYGKSFYCDRSGLLKFYHIGYITMHASPLMVGDFGLPPFRPITNYPYKSVYNCIIHVINAKPGESSNKLFDA